MKLKFAITAVLLMIGASSHGQTFSDADKAFIASEWGINVDDYPLAPAVEARANDISRQIEKELASVNGDWFVLADRMDRAVAHWVRVCALLMRNRGIDEKADELETGYALYGNGHFVKLYFQGVGYHDHRPWSMWLEAAYLLVEAALGARTMALLHLDDIEDLNYSVVVAPFPAGDGRYDPIREWTLPYYVDETSVYFAGPITYWAVYIGCTGATFGTAAVFACSPLGMGAEYLMANRVAPPIAERVYIRANP